MIAAAALPLPIAAIRSVGRLRLAFERTDDVTRMAAADQAGCLRVRVLRHYSGERTQAVLLNTGGGLTGGDAVSQEMRWEAGAAATVTTQAAEKVYRALDAPAMVATRIAVAAEADAEWLPQETILFDGASLDRRLTVDLHCDSRFLMVEALLFGRQAMGEAMARGRLIDRWHVRRDGRPVYADVLRLDATPQRWLDAPACGNGACAAATILLAAPDAQAQLAALRSVLDGVEAHAAASSWNGLLVVRLLAPDGYMLRRAMVRALSCLRGDRPLPRVWSC